MSASQIIFYIISATILGAGLLAVTSAKIFRAAIWLLGSLLGVAALYFWMQVEFIAAVQIVVYAGGIVVLIIFVIMMLNLNAEVEPHKPAIQKIAATIAGGILMIVLVGAFRNVNPETNAVFGNEAGLIKNLGNVLFKDFALPFEVSSILFLSAMVGAVMLGKKEIQ